MSPDAFPIRVASVTASVVGASGGLAIDSMTPGPYLPCGVPLRIARDQCIRVMYAAALVLGIGYGMAVSSTPIQLRESGFGKLSPGLVQGLFAAGVIALSTVMGSLVRRYSARVVLCWSHLGYAVAIGIFPCCRTLLSVGAARFADGAFTAGVLVASETLLLSRSDDENRGVVMSVYGMTLAVGYVLGPVAAKVILWGVSLDAVFFAASALATVAGGILFLGLKGEPKGEVAGGAIGNIGHIGRSVAQPQPQPAGRGRGLLWRIKTACFSTFAFGYFQAAATLNLPIFFMVSRGIPKEDAILLPTYFAAGMLVFSSLVSRLADRVGRLFVMRLLGATGALMVATFAFVHSWRALSVAIFVAGATLASLSPVALAMQAHIAGRHELARANAIYNTFYAVGLLAGPPTSSLIYARFEPNTLVWHLVALWGAFVAFTIVFFRDDPRARALGPAAT